MEARPPSFLQNTTSAEIPSTFHYGRVVCCYGQATPVEVNTSRYICPFSRASGEDHAAASRVVLPNCGIHRRECTPISWTAIIGTRHGKRPGPKKYGRKVDTLTNSPRSCLMTHMYMQIRRRDHPVPQFFFIISAKSIFCHPAIHVASNHCELRVQSDRRHGRPR